MSTPATFLRPLRYGSVRSALVLQTGPASRVPGIVERVRAIFPGCQVEVVLRERPGRGLVETGADRIRLAPDGWSPALVRSLRRERYDVIALQLGTEAAGGGRVLPLLLRCRSVIVFNSALDYFPLNASRLADLARHLGLPARRSAAGTAWALLRRGVAEALLAPLRTVYLLLDVARLRLRGRLRRLRRG